MKFLRNKKITKSKKLIKKTRLKEQLIKDFITR